MSNLICYGYFWKPRPNINEKAEKENEEINIIGYTDTIHEIFCKQLETDEILKKHDVIL